MSKTNRLSGLLRRSWYGYQANTEQPPSLTRRRSRRRPSVLVDDVIKVVFEFVAQPNQQPFGNLDKKTYKTLHSCLLVNRAWCRVAVQPLWRQPFFCKRPAAQITMMEILLSSLTNRQKQYLANNGVPVPTLATSPAFDYAYFIKHIDFENFIEMVLTWSASIKPSVKHSSYLIAKVLLGFIFGYSPSIERLRLSCFLGHTETAHYYEILLEPEIHHNLIHLRQLEICGQFYAEVNILAGLSIMCKQVENLYLGNWCLDSWCRNLDALKEDVIALFNGLTNVRMLEIDSNESFIPIPSCIMDSFTNVSNSVEHARFRCIDFSSKACQPLHGLASCRKLETLEFIDCDQVCTSLLAPLTAESLPNLSKVRMDWCSASQAENFWNWVGVVNSRRR